MNSCHFLSSFSPTWEDEIWWDWSDKPIHLLLLPLFLPYK
jgi:hypothetical protein